MRNSMHLQVPTKNSQIDKHSAEAYQDQAQRQRSQIKYLKQINFDDLIPGSQYNASFDLSSNMLRGSNIY